MSKHAGGGDRNPPPPPPGGSTGGGESKIVKIADLRPYMKNVSTVFIVLEKGTKQSPSYISDFQRTTLSVDVEYNLSFLLKEC